MKRTSHEISGNIEQQLLKTLVPVNALTDDHLKTLLRDQAIEAVCKGDTLFTLGENDHDYVYLLSGEITLTDASGDSFSTFAEDAESRFPLSDHYPRRHSAVAKTDCSIIRFDADQLDAMLAWDQASRYIMLDIVSQRDLDEDADWMMTLLKSNLFYKVPPMNIQKILNKFTAKYVSSGETVLRQGELGDCCYYIKEGVAGVYQSPDDKSAFSLVAELGVGRCFGEDALVNRDLRNATITMHTNGVLMRLDKQDFFLLLRSPGADGVNLGQAKSKVGSGAGWIDVRTQDEYDRGHCEGAVNMPLDLLKLKSRLLQDKEYVLYCNSGRRSEAAAYLLSQDGFKVSMLVGGFSAYASDEQKYFSASSLQASHLA